MASVLAGLALWLGQARATGTQSGIDSTHAPWDETSVRQLTSGPLNAMKPEYSPDGRRLLYLSPDPTSTGLDLFLMPAGGGTPWQLTRGGLASGDRPVFTPDGARIVFSRIRSGADGTRLPDLWVIPSSGGTPSLLLPEASGAGFSPIGTEIAYT
jgi:Tol biopolymer transport system component